MLRSGAPGLVRPARCGGFAICPAAIARIYLEFEVRRVQCRSCGTVKRERLDFLADNPFYTKRFAFYVGRRCRSATIKDVAEELQLDWDTVKELEKQYMRAQLAAAGTPGPKVIGIDEISIRKGHTYRIVVSDLDRGAADLVRRRGPLRGEHGRSSTTGSGEKKSRGHPPGGDGHVEAVSQRRPTPHAPQAAILFDKFHVMRHLGEALDKVRKSEYARLGGKDRRFIKGQKYTLLSRRENLTLERPASARRRCSPPTSG